MGLPSPYFKNIQSIGDLEVEEVIVDYEYPLLMTLKDNQDNRYLCACFDTRNSQQWVLSKISVKDLIMMLSDKLTLCEAFLTQATLIHIVYDYRTKGEVSTDYTKETVPMEWLPTPGEYLEVEDGEFGDFIKKLEEYGD